MADKITLAPIANPQNLTSLAATLNSNFSIIQTAMDNTLSRDGTTPDQMLYNLDMNSNQIINLPAPATANSPARISDVNSTVAINFPPVGTSGAVVGLLNGNNTTSGNNIHTGTETFTSGVNFNAGVTFPANSISTANIQPNAITTALIAPGAVQNSDLANMGALTIKGNATGSSAVPQDLTAAQVATIIGGWNNVSNTFTSGHTVTNSDQGTTLLLGGGAYFTVTLNAPNTYTSGQFVCRLWNSDTVRAKLIAPSGLSSFLLYPGQNCFIFSSGGVWVVEQPGRWRKQGVTLYVDANNGSDSNDGLSPGAGAAYQHIQAAVTALYNNIDCMNAQPTINIASGTYTESVSVQGQTTGFNFFLLQGAGSSVVTWKPSSNFCLLVSDNAECQVSGIKFDNTGGSNNSTAISMHQYSVIDVLNDIIFGNFPGPTSIHISNDKGGYVNLPANYTLSGSVGYHIFMTSGATVTQAGGGSVIMNGCTIGTCVYEFVAQCFLNFAGTVGFSTSGASIGQQYNLNLNCSFSKSGSALPGSAGAATNGSFVI